MNKVYEIITDQIIEKLEQGVCPWRMPWSSDAPKNLTSGKAYRGINILLLGSQGYANPYWLTFKRRACEERREVHARCVLENLLHH